jgi:hypothetical protein
MGRYLSSVDQLHFGPQRELLCKNDKFAAHSPLQPDRCSLSSHELGGGGSASSSSP